MIDVNEFPDQRREHRPPSRRLIRIGNSQLIQTALHARQMTRQFKDPSAVDGQHFVNAVTEQKAAIENRYARVGGRHELAVKKHTRWIVRH